MATEPLTPPADVMLSVNESLVNSILAAWEERGFVVPDDQRPMAEAAALACQYRVYLAVKAKSLRSGSNEPFMEGWTESD